MHNTAYENTKKFYSVYYEPKKAEDMTIAEIGSQNVNGSVRDIFPQNWKYIGMDIQEGNGVDITIENEYTFPLENESVDCVVTISCFEHSQMFWLSFLEGLRILKPNGLLYINVPTNTVYHPYPQDAWRFFPDAGKSLETWAQYNKLNTVLLESFVSLPVNDGQFDNVMVFAKDKSHMDEYTNRIVYTYDGHFNIRTDKQSITDELLNPSPTWWPSW